MSPLEVVSNEVNEVETQYQPVISNDDDVQKFLAEPMDKTQATEFISTFGVQPLKRTRTFDRDPWHTFEEIDLALPTRDKLFAFVRYSLRTGNGHALPTAANQYGNRRPLLVTKGMADYLKVALKAVLTLSNATEQFSVSAVQVGSHRDSKFNIVLRPIVTKDETEQRIPLKVFAQSVCDSITF